MMAQPLALQLRNLQTMVQIGVEKNLMIMFPAPLVSTIGEVGAFLSRETAAACAAPPPPPVPPAPAVGPEQTAVASQANGEVVPN